MGSVGRLSARHDTVLVRPYPRLQYQDLGFKVHMYSFDGPLLLPKTYDSLAQTLFGPGTEHNIYMERLPRCSTS